MDFVRQPSVAGHFYPADQTILAATVNELLNAAKTTNLPAPKAIIAPHAGYIYSGPIAATIYKTIASNKNIIQRVVLLGPAHRLSFFGIAVTRVNYFATPLGTIPVDNQSINSITKLTGITCLEQAYDMEHCLEVQLPFLQKTLNSFSIIPCIVGNARPEDIANLLLHLWGGSETLIVISSDLSHYHDYASAQKLDTESTAAILNLQPEKIADNQACGRLPIKGLLLAAAQLQLKAQVLDLRNSGDTAGNKTRVVGYGAYYFH